MAYDGTDLYVNDGAFFGTNTIYKIDPADRCRAGVGQPGHRRISRAWPPGGQPLWRRPVWRRLQDRPQHIDGDLAVLQAQLYPMTGLTGDPDNGMLYAVSPVPCAERDRSRRRHHRASGTDNTRGLNEQDIAYSGGQLFVSDTNARRTRAAPTSSTSTTPRPSPYLRRMPVAVYGFVSGLAGGTGAPEPGLVRGSRPTPATR